MSLTTAAFLGGTLCFLLIHQHASPCIQRSTTKCKSAFDTNDNLIGQNIPGNFLKRHRKTIVERFTKLKISNVFNMSKLDCTNVERLSNALRWMDADMVTRLEEMTDSGSNHSSLQQFVKNKLQTIEPIMFEVMTDSALRTLFENMYVQKEKACKCNEIYHKLSCITKSKVEKVLCGGFCTSTARCAAQENRNSQMRNYCYDKITLSISATTEIPEREGDLLLSEDNIKNTLSKSTVVEKIKTESIINKKDEISKTCRKTTILKTFIRKRILSTLNNNKEKLTSEKRKKLVKLFIECKGSTRAIKGSLDDEEIMEAFSPEAGPADQAKILEILHKKNTITQDILEKYIKYIPKSKLSKTDTALIKASLQVLGTKEKTRGQCRALLQKLKTDKEFRDISQWTKETFKRLGNNVKCLSLKEIKIITARIILQVYKDDMFMNLTFTTRGTRAIFKKLTQAMQKAEGSFTLEDLRKLGIHNLMKLGARTIRKFVGSRIKDILCDATFANEISSMTIRKTITRAIIKKVLPETGGRPCLMKIPNFGKDMDLDSSSIQTKVAEMKKGSTTTHDTFTRLQSRRVCKELKKNLGEVADWTPQQIKGGARCHNVTEIRKLDELDSSILVDIAQSYKEGDDMKKMEVLGLTIGENVMSGKIILEEDMIGEKIGAEILAVMPKKALEKAAEDRNTGQAIVNTLATANMARLPCQVQQNITRFVFKFKNLDSNNELLYDNISDIGNVICGIEKPRIAKIEKDALAAFTPKLGNCPCFGKEAKKEINYQLIKKEVIAADPEKRTAGELNIQGPLLLEEPASDFERLDMNALDAVYEPITEELSRRMINKKYREKEFGFQNSDVNDEMEPDSKKEFGQSVIKVMNSKRTTTDTKRRRRSTGSLTCSDLEVLTTTLLPSLKPDQITAISEDEFKNCLNLIGSVNEYDSIQMEALVEMLKKPGVLNTNISAWTPENIQDAGAIIQGLHRSDIEQLIVDEDVVATLGEFDNWEIEKKMAMLATFLKTLSPPDMSGLTSSHLRSLGHITCGADTSQIRSINTATYQSAADAIGQVTSCSNEQLMEFAMLAKAAYGDDIASWDELTIATVGVVIAGMPKNDFSTLTESQINSIEPRYIEHIPVASLAAMDTSQLGYLSVGQAQSVTRSQFDGLSTDQQAKIAERSANYFHVKSGCPRLSGFWTITLILVVVAAFV